MADEINKFVKKESFTYLGEKKSDFSYPLFKPLFEDTVAGQSNVSSCKVYLS